MKTIKLGSEGEEALLLCRELKRNGYSVKESRTFTQEMKEAVIDFQQKNKLDADGIVGYRTWEVLFFTGHPITERLTEEDFILGILLGYDPLKQTKRYLKFKGGQN